jgi:MFS family permease
MSEKPVGYAQLLRQNRPFRLLWGGQLVSNLGDWFNNVAVLALVFDLTRSGLATGLLIIASTLPAFVLTPFAGVVVDRFDRRRIMMSADLIRALLALGMLLVRTADQIWLIYIFSALLITFSSFFGPALNSAIPNLVSKEELISANALSSSTWGLMLAVGAAAGGLVIAIAGRDLAFVVNSLSFAVSAATIFLIRRPFGQSVSDHAASSKQASTWLAFRDSLAFARTNPQVGASLMIKVGWGLAAGVILLLTIFAQGVFQVGDVGIGWLYSARGLGALIGPYLARPLVGYDMALMRRAVLVSYFVTGVAYLGFTAAPAFWLAAVAVLIAHIGGGIIWTLSSTMLQLLTPDRLRGRIFATDFGLVTITNALSTFGVGVALERWDPRSVALTMSLIFIVYGIVWGGGVYLSRRGNAQAWERHSETQGND